MSTNIETLLSERQAKKYMDNYIAMDSIKNKKVLAYGKNAVEVYREASSKGHKYFFVIYVPKIKVHIYQKYSKSVKEIRDVISPQNFNILT